MTHKYFCFVLSSSVAARLHSPHFLAVMSSVVKNMFFYLFCFFILIKKNLFFYYFFPFFFCYQSYDCVVSPYFVYRAYLSTHNNTHNNEKSSNFQNQKFIDETDHINVRIISQIRTNLYTSSL